MGKCKTATKKCKVKRMKPGDRVEPVAAAFGEDLIGDLFAGAGGTGGGVLDGYNVIREYREENGLIDEFADNNSNVKMFAINHWDIALSTHKRNHPDIKPYCADLEDIDPRAVVPSKKLRGLVASPVCFPAGVTVITEHGTTSIEEVTIGTLVLTHKNRWKPVTKIQRTETDKTSITSNA